MAECIQCKHMDLNDTDDYGDAYCTLRKRYYGPYTSACSSIEFANESYNNRESEYENGGSSCYLTSAMCSALGYEDDCEYLNILRNFRDTYMMESKECFPLLIQYEIIGPIISKYIAQDKIIANIMLEQYITKAIKFIKENNYQAAIDTYKNMIYFLMENYKIQNLDIDLSEVHFNHAESLDKQKIRTLAKDAKLIRK